MKTAFMYAGQGAQHIGMGSDFYIKSLPYKGMIDSLNLGDNSELKKIMDEGPDALLTQTENTQPAMTAYAIGVTEELKNRGINPDMVCGLSIGEYGALYAAGILSASDCMDIVKYRGMVMAEAGQGIDFAMSAVIGLTSAQIQEIINEIKETGYITISNYNCVGQYVICGEREVVEICESKCREAGALQCIRLNVSGPFHTKYMQEAAARLRNRLDTVQFHMPIIPILMNISGDFYNGTDDFRTIMEQQIISSVRFEEEIQKMLKENVELFVEIGPGKALSGFVKRMAKASGVKVNICSVNHYEDMDKIISFR